MYKLTHVHAKNVPERRKSEEKRERKNSTREAQRRKGMN